MTRAADIAPGTIIADKYRVERVLGEGGMGFVVAAKHLELEQLVAVKFLHGGALSSTESVVRFMREAQAAARIRSEHVARVIDVSRLPDGEPYMVLEYLDGRDLGAIVQAGPLALEDVVDYVGQACHAIAEAHAAGIVHRDLKPSNLFLTRRPDGTSSVKVLDFGISKLTSGVPDAQLTKTSAIMGSPLYMSPEQMKSSRDVDPRSDIWSLGVIVYELVCGTPPFSGETLTELVTAVMMSEPVALTLRRPDVPPGLAAVVHRCLEKDPARRFQSVADFAQELLPFAPRRSQLLIERVAAQSLRRPATPAAQATGAPPASDALDQGVQALSAASGTAAPWSQTRPPASGGRKAVLWIAGVAIAALGLAYAGRSSSLGEAAAPSPTPSIVTPSPVAASVNVPAEPAAAPHAIASNAPEPLLPTAAPAASSVRGPAPTAATTLPAKQVVKPSSSAAALNAAAPAAPATPAATPTAAAPPPPANSKTLAIPIK